MANRFPNAIDQILNFYDSGLLDCERVPLLFQFFPQSFERVVNACETRGISWCAYGSNAYRPELTGDVVIYPFNNPANAAMVSNRANRHVLLMHGESNKVALIKPLARLYDHVLVAGNIACERLVEAGIFSQADIDGGRAIRMGTSVIGDFPAFRKERPEETGALAYCPTWEGGNDAENLCSLAWSEQAVLQAAEENDVARIVIRLHPHTGERLHPYRGHVQNLVRSILSKSIAVSYIVDEPLTQLEVSLREAFPQIEWVQNTPESALPIRLALTDVSALEAVMDTKRIPVRVLADRSKTIAAPRKYLDFCSYRVVWRDAPIKASELRVDPERDAQTRYLEELASYQSSEIEGMNHSERMDWLRQYVLESKMWAGGQQ